MCGSTKEDLGSRVSLFWSPLRLFPKYFPRAIFLLFSAEKDNEKWLVPVLNGTMRTGAKTVVSQGPF
jgi:hypothetical protein